MVSLSVDRCSGSDRGFVCAVCGEEVVETVEGLMRGLE